MKLEGLRKIIKEELAKALNEESFHNGETVLHMGQRFTVVKDSGNVGVEVQTKDGKTKMINRGQLKKIVKEEMQISRRELADLLKANDMGEHDNFIRTGNPSQKFLQDMIDRLESKGIPTAGIYVEKPQITHSTSVSKINPYDEPASKGYMGSKYRGD